MEKACAHIYTIFLFFFLSGSIDVLANYYPPPAPCHCPPPPPIYPGEKCPVPSCEPDPPPEAFENPGLYCAYKTIQTFKKTIKSDPKCITKSWVGPCVCDYKGFLCEKPPGKTERAVASVDFNGYGLQSAYVDDFINGLPDLAIFHANSNKFSGILSNRLATLPYLYELDLSNNNFTGPFPTAVLKIQGLLFLDLRFNNFDGGVPSGAFDENLEVLFLNNNEFSSSIPESLGSSEIIYLTFANNEFTGSIPRSIGKIARYLTEVVFFDNNLSGCLPSEIGYLENTTLFDVGSNKLTGPIPESFGCLKSLQELNLANNLLSGMIPESLCQLEKVQNLSLSDNYFTSIGPVCYSLYCRGILDLRKNCIPGLNDQRSPCDCENFVPETCPIESPCELPCQLHLPTSTPPPDYGDYSTLLHGPKHR